MSNRMKLEHSWCYLCLYHTNPRNLQINRAESCDLVIGRPSSESCAFGYWQNAKDPEAPSQLFLFPITFVRVLSDEPLYGTIRKFIYVPMERPSISATRWVCSEVIDLSSKKARVPNGFECNLAWFEHRNKNETNRTICDEFLSNHMQNGNRHLWSWLKRRINALGLPYLHAVRADPQCILRIRFVRDICHWSRSHVDP
jgi:hypothetical protein